MTVAVSGPISLTARERESVTIDLERRICDGDTVFSGGAFGVDTVAARVARALNATLVLVVPSEQWHHRGLYRIADEIVHVPGTYMNRNDRLADEADSLIAYPPTVNEERRSGTWATVRRFRKRDKPVTIVSLASLL